MNQRERALLFLEKAAEDEAVVSEWAGSPLISDSIFGFHCQQAVDNKMKEMRIKGMEGKEEGKGKSRSKSTSVSAVVLVVVAFAFAIFMVAPAIAGTITYDYDDAGRLVKADYGEGTAIEYEYDGAGNLMEQKITGEGPALIFDTGPGTYPSISGTHEGTITPNQTITVSKLYTYPCSGTGGHSEHVRIWNDTWAGMEASWTGYLGDWHNVTFPESFTLVANEIYNYTIRTLARIRR